MLAGSGFVFGQQSLDLKTRGDNDAFSGDSKSTVSIVPKEYTINKMPI
jgi:hypothetical protein